MEKNQNSKEKLQVLIKENTYRETYVFVIPYKINSKSQCKPFSKGIYVFYQASLNTSLSETSQ